MKCEACGHSNVDGARFCANCGAVVATHKDEADPWIGQVVGGRFRIKRVLGEGGMGIVYEADQQMGTAVRKVAVKTLHKQLSQDPSVAARFHRECGTVAQLEHPNTVKVYDFGTTGDGTLYIAMEFLDGQPLAQLIEQGAMEPSRVVHIVRQIAGSLDEAHNQGIIHRDLKPENVVLIERAGERDVVKLLDFGIAARTESADAAKEQKLTQQGMVLGTPPYMSPEQFTGKALDRRSDVYSLAVMTYEMLTGQLPFEASTPWQWATEHMTSRPRPFELTPVRDKVPAGMQAAIFRALEKDKELRQASARAFLDELSRGASGASVVVNTGAFSGAAVQEVASEHTAAMEAVPDFGSAPLATAKMPATPGKPATPGAFAAQVVAPAMPVPVRAGDGKGKGLIVGLASLGGVLLIAMVVLAVRSGSKEPVDEALANPFGGGPGKATIEADLEQSPTEPAAQPAATDPEPAEERPSAGPSKPSAPSKPATQSPVPAAPKPEPTPPKPDPTPPVTTTPPPAAPKPPEPSPAESGAAACRACEQAARSGDFLGAARNYQACPLETIKKRCRATVSASAPGAAKTAALNSNCNQALAIAKAAQSMGAGSGSLDAAVKKCK